VQELSEATEKKHQHTTCCKDHPGDKSACEKTERNTKEKTTNERDFTLIEAFKATTGRTLPGGSAAYLARANKPSQRLPLKHDVKNPLTHLYTL